MVLRSHLKRLTAVVVLAFAVSACQSTAEDNPKQTIGTLLGAGLGALAGSQVGGGKGKLAAAVIGALGGAYLGNQIGKSLDAADKAHLEKNAQDGLEYSKTGTTTAWKNPDSGNSGTFTPTKTYQTASNEVCREFETTIFVEGKEQAGQGKACRQPDGTWKIVQ